MELTSCGMSSKCLHLHQEIEGLADGGVPERMKSITVSEKVEAHLLPKIIGFAN
jgi:hypothetical protein